MLSYCLELSDYLAYTITNYIMVMTQIDIYYVIALNPIQQLFINYFYLN